MVKTILTRDERFVKVNKRWGLSEWYPAMRRGRGNASEADPKSTPKPTGEIAPKPSTNVPPPLRQGAIELMKAKPNETFTAARVAGALNRHQPTVKNVLNAMCKEGLIQRPKPGEYQALSQTA